MTMTEIFWMYWCYVNWLLLYSHSISQHCRSCLSVPYGLLPLKKA